jgi:hypothetical protein
MRERGALPHFAVAFAAAARAATLAPASAKPGRGTGCRDCWRQSLALWVEERTADCVCVYESKPSGSRHATSSYIMDRHAMWQDLDRMHIKELSSCMYWINHITSFFWPICTHLHSCTTDAIYSNWIYSWIIIVKLWNNVVIILKISQELAKTVWGRWSRV